MNITFPLVDIAALPADLLERCKQHLRVDHCDDDFYIEGVIARAIDYCQTYAGICINPQTVVWTPEQSDFCNNKARSAVMPINTMTATAGAADVSASYSFESHALSGAPAYYVVGAWQSGLKLTIETGWTADKLPFGIVDAVLSLAGHYYEHREIYVNSGTDVVPTWVLNSLEMWWVPRL